MPGVFPALLPSYSPTMGKPVPAQRKTPPSRCFTCPAGSAPLDTTCMRVAGRAGEAVGTLRAGCSSCREPSLGAPAQLSLLLLLLRTFHAALRLRESLPCLKETDGSSVPPVSQARITCSAGHRGGSRGRLSGCQQRSSSSSRSLPDCNRKLRACAEGWKERRDARCSPPLSITAPPAGHSMLLMLH